MVVSIALTGPSTSPGAPQNSPLIVNTAVNAALAQLLPLTGGTLTGPFTWPGGEINVKNYGAVLDGVTFDTTAFNAARIAAGDHSVITVPAGGWRLAVAPTGGSSGPVLWKLAGNCFTTGTTPVAGLGTDTVESFVAGSRFVGRQNSVADMGPVFRVDSTLNHSGGTSGTVMAGIKVNTVIPANASPLNNYAWGISSLLTSAATGPGQHVAVAGTAVRSANGSEIWGGNFGSTDTTGNASSISGSLVGAELDASGDGLDDGGGGFGTVPAFQGLRVILDAVAVRNGAGGAPALAHIGWGVRVTGGNGDQSTVQVERGFSVSALTGKAAFTSEFAVMATGANAFRMAADQTLAFDATGTHTLTYNVSGTKLRYLTGATELFSVSDAGNALVAGTLGVTGAITGASLQATGLGTITAGSVGAQNGLRLSPIASLGIPSLAALGPDTDITINIVPKGAGVVATPSPFRFSFALALSSTLNSFLSMDTNITGGGYTGGRGMMNVSTSTDVAAQTLAASFPLLNVSRNFGGVGTAGPRQGAIVQIQQSAAIALNVDDQYVALLAGYRSDFNAGGTGLGPGQSQGAGYAFYPQVQLAPGATNYTIASLMEGDLIVRSTTQPLTVSGAIANGDVITLTFTGATIVGSPLAVTYTAGTGNLATHIVNGLMAAINANAALRTAGIAGDQDITTSTILNLYWQTQATVSVAVGTTGAETLTLGTVVSGASTREKAAMSIARGFRDSQQGVDRNVALEIGDATHAPVSGQYTKAISIGSNGVWPVSPLGTLLGATEQVILNQTISGPFSAMKAKYGIDWSQVNFSQASGASLRMPGFQVDGAGVLSLKNATFTTDTTGLTIDVVGRVGSGNPAIVAGGGGGAGSLNNQNYFVGDIVKDANGGQYLVTTTNASTGAVTALTTLVQPSTATASLGTGIATTGGSGAGLTITPTGVANTTLALLPTAGGKLGFNGATPIVKPTGVAITAAGIHAALTSLGLIAP